MVLPIFIGEKMAKHILSCSFGKDSIATALLALQHGEPLDELVYCEVMFSEEISGELPEHNRFIHETAIPYFEQRGIPTRVLRSEKTYLSCFYHVVTRGKTKGMLSGFPLSGRCTIQRDCKLPPIKAYQKALPPDTVQYIGIAADEPKRLARLNAALERVFPKIDMEKIAAFIDGTPVISDLQKQFYSRYLQARYDLILSPAYKLIEPQK